MKELNTGKSSLLFMKVAPDANNFRISEGKFPDLPKGDLFYDTKLNVWNTGNVILPIGNWSDPIRVEEVTEEIARTIIPDKGGKIFDYDPKHYHSYEDFTLSDHPFDSRFFDNALESFQSFLKANEIYTVNPYQSTYTFGTVSEEVYKELEEMYNSGQSNTGNWIMLIKQK